MKIIVIGAGEIGKHLITQLIRNHRIIVVERDKGVCDQIASTTNAIVLNGDIRDQEILKEIRIEDADVLMAVTSSDEINFLIASYAKKKGVKRVIARGSQEEYAVLMRGLEIEPFIPSIAAAERLSLSISRPIVHSLISEGIGNLEIYDISIREKHMEIMDFSIKKKLVGSRIADLPHHDVYRIITVFRDGHFVLPIEDIVLKEGDVLVMLCESNKLEKVIKVFQK